MNKKGFTLIELLAIIVLMSIIMIITVPNVIEYVKGSKNTSYNILIKNIVTASKTYYEECEYGDLSDAKYGKYACKINDDNSITTTLGALANTGMLSVKDVDPNDKNKKVVLDPRDTKNDMSSCQITITKTKEEVTDDNGIKSNKVTYKVEAKEEANTTDNCPKTKEYGSE